MRRRIFLGAVLCGAACVLCYVVMNLFFVSKPVSLADHVERSDTGLEWNLDGDQLNWRHTVLDFAVSPDGKLFA